MKKTGGKRMRGLTIMAMADIPELRGKRGELYRPYKKPITLRVDADVLEWLKEDGRGYQTRANRVLRAAMIRDYRARVRKER